MRKQTVVSSVTTRFTFIELALGWMPIFTRRSRACTCQILSARLSKNGSMVTFVSDASLLRHTSTRDIEGSEGVAALGSGFCARSLLSCQKLHWSPFEHWPFSFHWVIDTCSSSTPINPFRSLATAPVSILSCLRQSFVIEVSD